MHETQNQPPTAFVLATATAGLTDHSCPSGKICTISAVHLSIRSMQPVRSATRTFRRTLKWPRKVHADEKLSGFPILTLCPKVRI
jgi:hypothetical protein